jgi:hypothetical protein
LRKQAAEAVTAATVAERAAQDAKNPPEATAAPSTGVEALPEPFSAADRLAEGPVIRPVDEAVARTEEGSNEIGIKEVRSNEVGNNEEAKSEEAGSKEAGSKEAGSKEAGSTEQAANKSAASDDAIGNSATGESVAATESTPSHDQQQPA